MIDWNDDVSRLKSNPQLDLFTLAFHVIAWMHMETFREEPIWQVLPVWNSVRGTSVVGGYPTRLGPLLDLNVVFMSGVGSMYKYTFLPSFFSNRSVDHCHVPTQNQIEIKGNKYIVGWAIHHLS